MQFKISPGNAIDAFSPYPPRNHFFGSSRPSSFCSPIIPFPTSIRLPSRKAQGWVNGRSAHGILQVQVPSGLFPSAEAAASIGYDKSVLGGIEDDGLPVSLGDLQTQIRRPATFSGRIPPIPASRTGPQPIRWQWSLLDNSLSYPAGGRNAKRTRSPEP